MMEKREGVSENMQEKRENGIVYLGNLVKGERGRVVAIDAEGEFARRIREMGFVPGASVEIMGHAPLQDPVAVRVKGCTLSLRKQDARYIQVALETQDIK